jgi:aminoglycoside 3-N-acetyltransferase
VGSLLVTRQDLVDDLTNLGVREGMVLLVHASLSAIGWVAGGEQSLLEALSEVVGDSGTLVMPTQSWQLCDPAYLNVAQVPRAWWPRIRDDLDSPVGERSPLKSMVDLGGWVLLLGVGHKKSTTLHLGEHHCDYPGKHDVRNAAPVTVDGTRTWTQWDELWVADDDFEQVFAAFAQSCGLVRSAQVGQAPGLLMPQRELVEFAASWFPAHRDAARFARDTSSWGAENLARAES